jgi:hypothetical protein
MSGESLACVTRKLLQKHVTHSGRLNELKLFMLKVMSHVMDTLSKDYEGVAFAKVSQGTPSCRLDFNLNDRR